MLEDAIKGRKSEGKAFVEIMSQRTGIDHS